MVIYSFLKIQSSIRFTVRKFTRRLNKTSFDFFIAKLKGDGVEGRIVKSVH